MGNKTSYPRTIQAKPGQIVFVRDIISNLASVIDWRVINTEKQRQVDIDNVQEDARKVKHNYAISDLVYVEMPEIYRKLDYSEYRPYRITEVFTNGKVRFQWG